MMNCTTYNKSYVNYSVEKRMNIRNSDGNGVGTDGDIYIFHHLPSLAQNL